MDEMRTYSYEVLVPEKFHYDEKEGEAYKVVDREAKVIAIMTGVYPEPTRESLLRFYAKELADAQIDLGNVQEVIVRICPFCR